ncbi:unnamed protein product [Sphagnum jensenii]|uniref:Uncharacterized protein n=1 Tax=Sphagnum jensenii TaxID=128206 RepID=A0ABP1BRH3_9BRYO
MKTSACDNNTVLNRLRNESHGKRSSLQNLQHSEHAREGDYQQPTFDHNRQGVRPLKGMITTVSTVLHLRRRGQIHERQSATMMKTPRADLGTAGFLRGGCDAC